jgi:hypothetical protein
MVSVRPDAALAPDWHPVPVLWCVMTPEAGTGDYSDEVLARFLPEGKSRALRSFGHDADGVHWLLTRGGTPLHRDPAYARWSHQLVLRNDGNRLRGLPRYDDRRNWHPPLRPGVMYALDTHSAHQGLPDERLRPPPVVLKLVIAVDRDELLKPGEAYGLLSRLLHLDLTGPGQVTYAAPRRWS